MYKIDLHTHTAECSPCGHLRALDLVKQYAEAGYNGIVVTDHYYENRFDTFGEMSWKQKVDQYLVGYRTAKVLGRRFGLDVFLGIEYRDTSCVNDYIVLGLTEKFLYDHPYLYRGGIEAACRVFHEAGAFVYQAHPCRRGMTDLENPTFLDGMEVHNGNPRHEHDEPRARHLATSHGLLFLSGSDTHRSEDIGNGGILLEKKIRSSRELIREIRAGRYTMIE